MAYWQFTEQYSTSDDKTSGELNNMRDAAKPLAKLYGSVPTQDFRPTLLKSVMQQMIDAGLSRGTIINERINRIRRIFKWGVCRE